MTVVYADTLFLLNAIVDYLLLLGAARLAGEPLRRIRFGLGAVLGGLYAVALFLPGMEFLSSPLCRAASCGLMLVAAYGGSRRLLRQSIVFLALTCAFGGGVVAIGWFGGGSLQDSLMSVAPDLKVILLSAAICYVGMTLVFQRVGIHTALSGELIKANLRLGERCAEVVALVDTGNTLSDPATGRPVMVAEGERLKSLFPREHCPSIEDLRDPARGLERLGTGAWKGRFRLLPYRAVGVDRGLWLALNLDGMILAGKEQGPLLVALSPTPVSDGGGYCALVGTLD